MEKRCTAAELDEMTYDDVDVANLALNAWLDAHAELAEE
jgi:hypothetical protein